MNRFFYRFFRAAKLDVSLYQEIVEDAGALNQALIVVFIYSMAAANRTRSKSHHAGIGLCLRAWCIACAGFYAGYWPCCFADRFNLDDRGRNCRRQAGAQI